MPWACVHTYGGMERRAVENLERQAYQVACPLVRDRKPRSLKETILRPLFPCYVFAYLELDQRWLSINSTRGVIRLLTTRGEMPEPLFLPDGLMDSWRDPVDKTIFVLAPGTRVRVCDPSHPLYDYEGVVEEMTSAQRVHVLMGLFNRHIPVRFDSSAALETVT